mgnify:CR=1 FL=1
MFELTEVPVLSSDGVALKRFIIREPISIFSQIKNVKMKRKKRLKNIKYKSDNRKG